MVQWSKNHKGRHLRLLWIPVSAAEVCVWLRDNKIATSNERLNVLMEMNTENQVNTKLTDYFAVYGVVLTDTGMKGKMIRLNDSHLSAGLDYLYQ